MKALPFCLCGFESAFYLHSLDIWLFGKVSVLLTFESYHNLQLFRTTDFVCAYYFSESS